MLSLSREERNKEGLAFVDECKSEYDRLIEQSPAVPTIILTQFENEYPLDNMFTKPEILSVRSIPLIKPPKTINPIRAVTENTPLARVGEILTRGDVEEEETDVEQGTQEV